MKTFWTLLKTQINITFGISALKYRFTKEKKRLWEPILIGISIIICLGSVMSFFAAAMLGLFIAGKAAGRPEIVLTIAFMSCQIIILFFGIVYLIGTFYFAKDIELLIPLPIKPSYVLGSKFAMVMIEEYLTAIPILLPALIIYGVGTGQGAVYLLKSIAVLLSAPVIPLAAAGLLVMVLMRFVNARKSKDLFTVLAGFAAIVFVLGWNTLIQRLPKTDTGRFFDAVLSTKMALIEQIGQKFPPSIWVTYGLSGSGLNGLGYMLLYLIVSLLLMAAILTLGNRIYYKTFLSGQETIRKRKALSRQDFDKKYGKVKSPAIAVFLREWKLFLRTPVFMLNGITGMVIAPFLLIMPIVSNKSEIGDLLEIINNPVNLLPVTLGALGVTLLTSNLNALASTAISREGRTFWVSKLIPVSPRAQISGKLVHGFVTELIGVLAAVATIAIAFKLRASSLIIILILSSIGNILLIEVNLIIDVLRPKLDWTNPQEAVKRNFNGVLGMLATVLVLGILAAACVVMVKFELPGWVIYTGIGIIMLALSVSAGIGLFALAERQYTNIEI